MPAPTRIKTYSKEEDNVSKSGARNEKSSENFSRLWGEKDWANCKLYLHLVKIDNKPCWFSICQPSIYPQKRMERIKTLSYPSHILQAQGDGIVSVLLLTVVTNGGVENPFIIQILHQST